jgi:hypothetical protein
VQAANETPDLLVLTGRHLAGGPGNQVQPAELSAHRRPRLAGGDESGQVQADRVGGHRQSVRGCEVRETALCPLGLSLSPRRLALGAGRPRDT